MNSSFIAAASEEPATTPAAALKARAEPRGEAVQAFRINFRRSLISREVRANYGKEAAQSGAAK